VALLDAKVTVRRRRTTLLNLSQPDVARGRLKQGALWAHHARTLHGDHVAVARIALGTALLRLVTTKLALGKHPLPATHAEKPSGADVSAGAEPSCTRRHSTKKEDDQAEHDTPKSSAHVKRACTTSQARLSQPAGPQASKNIQSWLTGNRGRENRKRAHMWLRSLVSPSIQSASSAASCRPFLSSLTARVCKPPIALFLPAFFKPTDANGCVRP